MKMAGGVLFTVGSLSWAVAQWLLIWMFARFAGGADAVGSYSTVLSIVTPVFILAQFGLRTVFISLRIQFPWRSFLILRIAGIIIGVVLLAGYVVVTRAPDVLLWVCLLALKVADTYFDLLQARIQRSGQLSVLGALNLFNSIGTILFAALALATVPSVPIAIAVSAFVSVVISIVGGRVVAGLPLADESKDSGYVEIIRAAFPTTISEVLASVSTYLPILLLSRSSATASVGVYMAASYLLTFANLAGAILKNVLITSFRETLQRDGLAPLKARSGRYVAGTLGMGCVAAVPVALFGGQALNLVYGPGFSIDVIGLALLGAAMVPIVPSYIYSAALNVLHRFAFQAWSWGLSLGVGLIVGIAAMTVGIEPIRLALLVALSVSWTRFLGSALMMLRPERDQAL